MKPIKQLSPIFLLLLIGTLFPNLALKSQDYDQKMKEARSFLNQREYKLALDRCFEARVATDRPPTGDGIDPLIGQITELWVQQLEELVQTAEENAQEARRNEAAALVAKNEAVQALELADSFRVQEEEALRRELLTARKLRATSLTLFANSELDNDEPEDAYALAYQAYQIYIEEIKEEPSDEVKLTFGNAVAAVAAKNNTIELEAGITLGGFLPENQLIYLISRDSNGYLYSLDRQLVGELKFHSDLITKVKVSAQGSYLATLSKDGTVGVWDKTGKLIRHLIYDGEKINSGEFSPDEQKMLTGTKSGKLILWDLETGDILKEVEQLNTVVGFDNSEKYVLARSYNQVIILNWAGEVIGNIDHNGSLIYTATFAPESELLVTASSDKTAKVWNISGQMQYELPPHVSIVSYAAFSSKGEIITCTNDVATIWKDGDLKTTLSNGHNGMIRLAVFSKDGQYVITIGDDHKIFQWDVSTGEKQLVSQHVGKINKLTLSPTNNFIISAAEGEDKTVKMTEMSPDLIFSQKFDGNPQAIVSNDSRHILMFSTDGKAIICPNPMVLLEEINNGSRRQPALGERIISKYNLQGN